MAKGFAAGLIQGAVICGAGLVVLSLAMPQPPRPSGLADVPVAELATGAENPAAGSRATETLSVPAGSEFARGTDMQPQPPQPLTAAPRLASPPVVAAPADEIAPEAAETERQRPEARGEAPAAPAITLRAPEPVALPDAADKAPVPLALPGRVVVPTPDRAPESGLSDPGLPRPTAPRAGQAGQADAAPVLSRPETPPEIRPEPQPEPAEAVAGLAAPAPAPLPAVQARPAPDPQRESAPLPVAVTPEAPPASQTASPPATAPGSGFDLSLPPGLGDLRLND
ncbi:hypothetical protein [Paracoccus halophilus]|uniref:hypothetical protein n=1 Tax=Paracoccus halophilus TaxID=376733 RepID=UPI000691F523|nr:hypothetical protein [Paracoccus halophilus]